MARTLIITDRYTDQPVDVEAFLEQYADLLIATAEQKSERTPATRRAA